MGTCCLGALQSPTCPPAALCHPRRPTCAQAPTACARCRARPAPPLPSATLGAPPVHRHELLGRAEPDLHAARDGRALTPHAQLQPPGERCKGRVHLAPHAQQQARQGFSATRPAARRGSRLARVSVPRRLQAPGSHATCTAHPPRQQTHAAVQGGPAAPRPASRPPVSILIPHTPTKVTTSHPTPRLHALHARVPHAGH